MAHGGRFHLVFHIMVEKMFVHKPVITTLGSLEKYEASPPCKISLLNVKENPSGKFSVSFHSRSQRARGGEGLYPATTSIPVNAYRTQYPPESCFRARTMSK